MLDKLELEVVVNKYGRLLWIFRAMPEHALHYLTGIALPPHEITWIRQYFSDYKDNHVVGSRGTSKTFAICSVASPLKSLLYRNLDGLTVSASGFRGGQEIFKDTEKLFLGNLKSQKKEGSFMEASLMRGLPVIHKGPSMWTIELNSRSSYRTIPTGNAEQIRGLRSQLINADERNTYPEEEMQTVIRPIMNVGDDFDDTAQAADKNQLFSLGTIDYTWRGWWDELEAMQRMAQKEYDAAQALKSRDWSLYEDLYRANDRELQHASFSYSKFDYTDLIIPEYVSPIEGSGRGKTYKVNYPEDPQRPGSKIRYDISEDKNLIYTYPVDKEGLEQPLLQGTADRDLWGAEQRNHPVSASGKVFNWQLITKVSERPIYGVGEIPDYPDYEEEYYAPLMYTCGDPCVAAMDYGRERAETALTVIRLGELAEQNFDPYMSKTDEQGRVFLGKSTWNHVCWAETWQHLPADVAAEKLREAYERYNLIYVFEKGKHYGGVGLDWRAAGSAVKDALGAPKPPVLDNGLPDSDWDFENVIKIFDPNDNEGGYGHYIAKVGDEKYWGGLHLISASATTNAKWTFSTKALMQQSRLYIAKHLPPSQWAAKHGLLNSYGQPDRTNKEYHKWDRGYSGVLSMKKQLLKLESKYTESGNIKFYIPGDDRENMKDLWASTIYATSLAIEHLQRVTAKPGTTSARPKVVRRMGANSVPKSLTKGRTVLRPKI